VVPVLVVQGLISWDREHPDHNSLSSTSD